MHQRFENYQGISPAIFLETLCSANKYQSKYFFKLSVVCVNTKNELYSVSNQFGVAGSRFWFDAGPCHSMEDDDFSSRPQCKFYLVINSVSMTDLPSR